MWRSSSTTSSSCQVDVSSSCTICVKDTHAFIFCHFICTLTIINQDIILTFKLHKKLIYNQNTLIAKFQEKDNQEFILDILLGNSLVTKEEAIFFQCLKHFYILGDLIASLTQPIC